jgi:hypothetical protein
MWFDKFFGDITHVMWAITSFLGWLLLLGVFLTVTILLVRFLLIGTRAATLYLHKNSVTTDSAAAPAPTSALTKTKPANRKPPAAKTPPKPKA